MVRISALIITLAFASPAVFAQAESSIGPLKRAYNTIEDDFVKAAEEMDGTNYSFKPTPELQSFGQRVAHIADANLRTCAIVKGEMKSETASTKTSKADLVAEIKASFSYCDSIVSSLTDAEANRVIGAARGGPKSELSVLWGMVSHDNEVYGTMTVYLRLKGLVPPSSQGTWDKVFTDPTSSYNRQPSRLLIDAIRGRRPGTAIDLGMGQGRNAIYLAQHGWQVTGVDLSTVGVGQAKARAAQLGVALDAHVADLDKFDFGRARWDLITLFYMHAWYHLSKLPTAQRLRDALKPGGLLVIEGYAGGELGFKTDELRHDFADLKILRYEDLIDEADWSPGQKSRLVRLIAQKP